MKILTEAAVQERKDWSLYLSLVLKKEYEKWLMYADDELAACMFDDIFTWSTFVPAPSKSTRPVPAKCQPRADPVGLPPRTARPEAHYRIF